MEERPAHIAIFGAGYFGLTVFAELPKHLSKIKRPVIVTLVNANSCFFYNVPVPRMLADPVGCPPEKLMYPLKNYIKFPKIQHVGVAVAKQIHEHHAVLAHSADSPNDAVLDANADPNKKESQPWWQRAGFPSMYIRKNTGVIVSSGDCGGLGTDGGGALWEGYSTCVLDYDYAVLAMGSGYAMPAKLPLGRWSTQEAIARLREAQQQASKAKNIVVIGLGSVGMEYAGELKSARPDADVTAIGPRILANFSSSFESRVRKEAAKLKINLIERMRVNPRLLIAKNASLFQLQNKEHQKEEYDEEGVAASFPLFNRSAAEKNEAASASKSGASTNAAAPQTQTSEPATIVIDTVPTWREKQPLQLQADYVLSAIGIEPLTSVVIISGVLDELGYIRVGCDLQVQGQPHIFAGGDAAGSGQAKMAFVAMRQGQTVAENLACRLAGRGQALRKGPTLPNMALMPMGPYNGVSLLPGIGTLFSNTIVRMIKGRDGGFGMMRGSPCEPGQWYGQEASGKQEKRERGPRQTQ